MLAYVRTYLRHQLSRFGMDERGAVATEYAFLIAFIAIVAAIGMTLLGQNLQAFFQAIGGALQGAGDNIPEPFS